MEPGWGTLYLHPPQGTHRPQGKGNPAVARGVTSGTGIAPCPCPSRVSAPPGRFSSSLHPKKSLKHDQTQAQRRLVAGGTHFCSSQPAEIFPKDKPCGRRERVAPAAASLSVGALRKGPPDAATGSTICHRWSTGLEQLPAAGPGQATGTRRKGKSRRLSQRGWHRTPQSGKLPPGKGRTEQSCAHRDRGHLTSNEDPGDEALQHLPSANPPTRHLFYQVCNMRCHVFCPQPALLALHCFQRGIFYPGWAAPSSRRE